ncbi:uncharacterized protein LOC116603698 [Nematostella vectensis]|uniref:uncharacterized protein LOC116603698 n=1 Tax=Nematostella vectensis TaxID=45351 RepID=UPI002077359F|nr:uncharacterized protein LOC116603698 [Nematostella vectensis]
MGLLKMDGFFTCFILIVSLFPVVQSTVTHYILGKADESCDDACYAHAMVCNSTSSFGPDVLAVFRSVGVQCKTDYIHNVYYNEYDPSVFTSGANKGLCSGFARVLYPWKCEAREPEARRLCACSLCPTCTFTTSPTTSQTTSQIAPSSTQPTSAPTDKPTDVTPTDVTTGLPTSSTHSTSPTVQTTPAFTTSPATILPPTAKTTSSTCSTSKPTEDVGTSPEPSTENETHTPTTYPTPPPNPTDDTSSTVNMSSIVQPTGIANGGAVEGSIRRWMAVWIPVCIVVALACVLIPLFIFHRRRKREQKKDKLHVSDSTVRKKSSGSKGENAASRKYEWINGRHSNLYDSFQLEENIYETPAKTDYEDMSYNDNSLSKSNTEDDYGGYDYARWQDTASLKDSLQREKSENVLYEGVKPTGEGQGNSETFNVLYVSQEDGPINKLPIPKPTAYQHC